MTATTPTDQPTPVEARASTTYALLPKGCKPSKSAGKDEQRPVLCHAELRHQTGRVGWEIVTSDSYRLARVQLHVTGDPDGLTAGPISPDALKAIEARGAGGFYATADTIEPCDRYGRRTGATFARLDPGQFPKWDQVDPGEYGAQGFEFAIDAELLHGLAQSLGAANHATRRKTGAVVVLKFAPKGNSKDPALRPILVRAKDNPDGRGLIMPIRVDA